MRARFFCALLAACFAVTANAYDKPTTGPDKSQLLGGDAGDACSMVLCLSNPVGKGLAECSAPLKKYFNLKRKKRPGFLSKCPMVKGEGGK